MDTKKIRKTLIVAFFVSISAQIHFDVLTDGFIVAMSSVVMAIFIYCYEDLTAAYIACMSGIFAPAVRYLIGIAGGAGYVQEALAVIPDMVFFFAYAAVYTLIYRFFIRAPKATKNFPYAVFFADFLGNICEMSFRSILTGQMLLSPRILLYLALVALVRTVLIMMVIVAIESYGNLLINQERDREYKRLLTQASTIEGEVRIMNKNMMDVEGVMKKAYDLYSQTKDDGYPKEVTDRILEIAKDTHEIKGDYRNVLSVLNDIYLQELREDPMRISEILFLERANVLAMAKQNEYEIDIITRIQSDFRVRESFKMMSVIRNLMTNAAEAIGRGPGRIIVTSSAEADPEDPFSAAKNYIITVRDNGPGISQAEIGNLFLEGYSTKFDPKTGNIQRGLGLSLVRDYVEQDFCGRIEVESDPGKFTQFRITIPADKLER